MPTPEQDIATLMERTRCLPQLVSEVTEIKLAVQRMEDRGEKMQSEHLECHATDMPSLKSDMEAMRTFRKVVCWGGGVIMAMLLSLWAAVAAHVVAFVMPLHPGGR